MVKCKEYLGFMLLGVMISSSTMAYDTCEGGTEIVAYTQATKAQCYDSSTGVNYCNGKKFCKSNAKLYWWTAVLWCRANGGTLVSYESACPNTPALSECYNLGRISTWINKLDSAGYAYGIDGGGYVRPLPILDSGHYALCE